MVIQQHRTGKKCSYQKLFCRATVIYILSLEIYSVAATENNVNHLKCGHERWPLTVLFNKHIIYLHGG